MKVENIKYKAKRLDNGEWIIGSFVVMKIPALSKTTIGIVAADGATLHEIDPSTVCQFTGLKDCENQDIYEGDIMAEKEYPEFEVGYINCTFAAAYVGDDKFIFNLTALSEVCTVCGNKFDKEKSRMEKKVLTVHLAEPRYSMIVSGQKTEEYRVIKPYWVARLFQNNSNIVNVQDLASCLAGRTDLLKGYINTQRIVLKPYTHILFVKGYPKGNKPSVEKEIESITIGKPKRGLCPDKWLDTEFFIIKFK